MPFNSKIALLGLATVVSSHGGNARFDIRGCDHLRLTEMDQCVETTNYGNNHDCTIRVLTDMRVDVRRWDVEYHEDCEYDYLESRGASRATYYDVDDNKKFCNGESPEGYDLWEGQLLHWHTDYSVTKGGWKICAYSKFRFTGRCDHLEITDGGNCLGTTHYGNDHDCQIETTGTFRYFADFFDVEGHDNCAWDYLKIDDEKVCGDNAWKIIGTRNRDGMLIEWHTDNSVTRGGFRVCGYSCFVTKTDFVGGDFDLAYTNSALECQYRCNERRDCVVFTYDSSNMRCYLKNNLVNPNYNAHSKFISGYAESICTKGNWRRLEDFKTDGSRLLKLDQVLDMKSEKEVKLEKEQ